VVLVLKKRHPQGVVSEEVQEIARGAVLGKLRDRLKDAIQVSLMLRCAGWVHLP
jgi:hypothetical protein